MVGASEIFGTDFTVLGEILTAMAGPASVGLGISATITLCLSTFTGQSFRTRAFGSTEDRIILFRTRRLLASNLTTAERALYDNNFQAEDFFGGVADFDYSMSTFADLVRVVESDLDAESEEERESKLNNGLYGPESFVDWFSAHLLLIKKLKEVDPTLTSPLTPAIATAVRNSVLRYRQWKPKAYDTWVRCCQLSRSTPNDLSGWLTDKVCVAKFGPYYLKSLAIDKQATAELAKACADEPLEDSTSTVSYADLMKGKVA